LIYERHFTREEANRLLSHLEETLAELRDARDRLTDAEAHELLSDTAPTNGGGTPGRTVGEAFLEVRRLLNGLTNAGIVVRDIERGLVDFPAVLDGREVFLCWEAGEPEVAYWHDLEGGYGGRRPLAD
jgi:hypothetical protein